MAGESSFGEGHGVSSSNQAAAIEETIESRPTSWDTPPSKPHVALVEGGTPHLSHETQELLRVRLRIAALLLFAGFLAFFIRHLFHLQHYTTNLHWTVFCCHLGLTLMTGFIGLRLCRQCSISLSKLRIAELLIFGAPVLYFLLLNAVRLIESAEQGFLPDLLGPWLVLIFTYALFIPNTWQRAAVVIGILAAAPMALVLVVWMVSPEVSAVLGRPEFSGFVSMLSLMLAISAVVAVLGVRTIGTLRRQAFVAKQLGQYRLKQLLGAGGMGEVYLAEHQLMKRPCAIKLVRPEKAGDPQVLARFEREVQATAKLSHWNTVEIFDYGRSEDGTFYYVMEYLPGLNLADLVREHGPLPAERAIHLLAQTCEALSEAHDKQLIHRDLKPANIFAAHRGGVFDVAKLLDLGLAKPLADLDSPNLTQEGTITGSPHFMSPEQATGEPPDARSDIYSLGAVGYYLLCGSPPFDGNNALKVLFAHAHEKVIPPSKIRDDIPGDLELVILRCLAKHPEERYQTAENLRQALLECDAADLWTRQAAADWWMNYGCPKKRAMDAAILEGVGV